MLDDQLAKLRAGDDLSRAEMADAIGRIMDGAVAEEQIADLLATLHRKGETADEVAGAATAMREHMTPIRSRHTRLLDVVGTGGDGSATLNISTAAAIVTAACGVPVAKHGNRAVTSRSGASDVLARLGVNIEASLAVVERCLDELGLCFCFAPLYHQAMKNVAAVRKRLPHPTVFNLLGPLVNPASASHQLLGVGRPELRGLIAEACVRLGTERAVVVHGSDGLDEVTLGATTEVSVATPGGIDETTWSPEQFGLPAVDIPQLRVDGPEQSAELIRGMLAGQSGPAREIVLANTAAALWAAEQVDALAEGVQRAAEVIDSGTAAAKLAQLVELSCRA
jgi:anthranilate phosphoribosyltransferase